MEYYIYPDKTDTKMNTPRTYGLNYMFSNAPSRYKNIAKHVLNKAIDTPNTRVSIAPHGLIPSEEYRDGVISGIKDLLRVSADNVKTIKGDRIIMLAPGSNHIVAFQEKDFSEYKEPEHPLEFKLDGFLQWAHKEGWVYNPIDGLWSESVSHKPTHRSKVATGYLYNKYLDETGAMK